MRNASTLPRFYASTLLLLLLLAKVGWGATYYVSPTGSNTSPYNTWAKAARLPSTAVTAGNTDVGGDGPHVLLIGPGTYDSGVSLLDTDWANAVVAGVSAAGVAAACNATNYTSYPAAEDEVVLSPSTELQTITVGVAGNSVSFLTITTANTGNSDGIYLNTSGSALVVNQCWVYDCKRFGLYLRNSATFTRCKVEGCGSTSLVSIANDAAVTMSDCLMTNSATRNAGSAQVLSNAATGAGVFNNCVFLGCPANGVSQSGTGSTTLQNCIVESGGGAASSAVAKTAGAAHVLNCLLLHSWANLNPYSGTMDTDTGNIVTGIPKFVQPRRSGMIVPCVDDSLNLAYAQSLETKLAARGMKGAFYVQGKDVVANAAALTTMVNNGTMSVGGHGWSHCWITLTGNVCTITKVGATINVDRAGDQIVVNPGGTVTGFKAKTLAAIKTELQGFGCTVGSFQGAYMEYSLGEIVADSSGAQASPYTPQILIDATGATGFYKVEIADVKTVLEANIAGFTATSFSTPGGTVLPANAQSAMIAAGWLGCRETIGAENTFSLTSANLFLQGYLDMSGYLTVGSPDAATLAQRTRNMCEIISQLGAIVYLLAHNTTECTMAQWDTILDTMAEITEITVTSHDEALDEIINGGDYTTADNITYTRTWPDQGDYHLQATSPCINAGAAVAGLTVDYAGTAVPQGALPDIGAYEFLLPTAATTPSPADDAVDVAVDASLSWAAVATATSYDVYLDDTLVSNDQAGTTYNPTDFVPYSTHTWRVDTNNAAGTTTGTEWSFTTEILGGVFSASDKSSKDSKNGGK